MTGSGSGTIIAHRPLGGEPLAEGTLHPESEAALRQLTHQRLLGYGVEYGDALELRAAVAGGIPWLAAAESLAERLCARIGDARSEATRRDLRLRASALLRMAQMMMLADDETRRSLYRRAAALFGDAFARPDMRRVVETGGGPVVSWLLPAETGPARGTILIIGGIEGWAMDLCGLGEAVAARGFDAVLLDGPGQGETRLEHAHFLTTDWRETLGEVVGEAAARRPGLPVGIIGNSMGGNFALLLASADARIAACCNNGGLPDPLTQRARSGFFPKMEAFCGPADAGEVDRIWTSAAVTEERLTLTCPLLIVQGGLDPLVSVEASGQMLGWARSAERRMHVFEDGDHCIYKRPADKHALIGDWFVETMG